MAQIQVEEEQDNVISSALLPPNKTIESGKGIGRDKTFKDEQEWSKKGVYVN